MNDESRDSAINLLESLIKKIRDDSIVELVVNREVGHRQLLPHEEGYDHQYVVYALTGEETITLQYRKSQ